MPLPPVRTKTMKPMPMCRDTSGRPTERKLVIDIPLQFNIPKGVEEDKKVNPIKVCEGFVMKGESKNVKGVKAKKSKKSKHKYGK